MSLSDPNPLSNSPPSMSAVLEPSETITALPISESTTASLASAMASPTAPITESQIPEVPGIPPGTAMA